MNLLNYHGHIVGMLLAIFPPDGIHNFASTCRYIYPSQSNLLKRRILVSFACKNRVVNPFPSGVVLMNLSMKMAIHFSYGTRIKYGEGEKDKPTNSKASETS